MAVAYTTLGRLHANFICSNLKYASSITGIGCRQNLTVDTVCRYNADIICLSILLVWGKIAFDRLYIGRARSFTTRTCFSGYKRFDSVTYMLCGISVQLQHCYSE